MGSNQSISLVLDSTKSIPDEHNSLHNTIISGSKIRAIQEPSYKCGPDKSYSYHLEPSYKCGPDKSYSYHLWNNFTPYFTHAISSFLKEFTITKAYDYKIGTITEGYDFYALLLGKLSIWFTKKTLFQDIIYYADYRRGIVPYFFVTVIVTVIMILAMFIFYICL